MINLNKLKTIFFTLCESNKNIENNEKEIKEDYNEDNQSENNEINNIENCNNIEENNNSFIEEKKSEEKSDCNSYLNEDNKLDLNKLDYNKLNYENKNETEINEIKTDKNIINEKNNIENYSKDQIDFTLFLESLAISAMFFNYKNMLDDMDRMLFLAERIYQSKPINKVIMKNEMNNNINKLF